MHGTRNAPNTGSGPETTGALIRWTSPHDILVRLMGLGVNGANSRMITLQTIFSPCLAPNGSRYAPSGVPVGGTRERSFAGTNLKPCKLPENAPTPTTTVLAFVQGPGARCVERMYL